MEETCKRSGNSPSKVNVVLKHFRDAIENGKHWYVALLEVIALWPEGESSYKERLILGEALDWLSIAEQILKEPNEHVPPEQRDALLFNGQPPLHIPPQEIKAILGETKYGQYLNYFYGIVVEEALQQSVINEIRKERMSQVVTTETGITEEAFKRIYETEQEDLLKEFFQRLGRTFKDELTTTELKEFNYWLFKYRVEHCDKAKVASDTKKALAFLSSIRPV